MDTTHFTASLGFQWDYFEMSHLPWDKLQMLRQWDGQ